MVRFLFFENIILEYTPLIKKFQKIKKNTNLFIKIDTVPFKVLLIDYNALMPALNLILEIFFILGFRYDNQEPFSILKMKSSLHQRVCRYLNFALKWIHRCENVEEVLLYRKQTFMCGPSFRQSVENDKRSGIP